MNVGRVARTSVVQDPLATEEVRALQRRTLRVVVASQVLGGVGLAAGVTVGALLAEQMLGSDGLAGQRLPCSHSDPP